MQSLKGQKQVLVVFYQGILCWMTKVVCRFGNISFRLGKYLNQTFFENNLQTNKMLQECFPDRFLNILKAPKVSYYRFFLWETCIFARQTSKQTKGRNRRNKLTKPQESSRIKAQVPERCRSSSLPRATDEAFFYLVSDIMFIECVSQRGSFVNIFQDKI